MLGILVAISGNRPCIAAVPGKNQLQATIVLGGRFGEPEISVTGCIEKPAHISESPIWAKQRLTVGDHVKIELVETDWADEPIESSTYDHSAHRAEMDARIEAEMVRLREQAAKSGSEATLALRETRQGPFCAFCGKAIAEVKRLIEGPSVHICDECLLTCNEILSGTHKTEMEGLWPQQSPHMESDTLGAAAMLGLRIAINGEQVCLAAVPEKNQLDAAVILGGSFDKPTIWVNGYIDKTKYISEHLTFGKQHLTVGDRVDIELVQTQSADHPVETSTLDLAFLSKQPSLEKLIARARLGIEDEKRRLDQEQVDAAEANASRIKRRCCSFCDKQESEVKRLIASPFAYICNECVEASNGLLAG